MSKVMSRARLAALAVVVVTQGSAAWAQAAGPAPGAAPIAPERLATILPSAAFGDTTREKPETAAQTTPSKRSEAKVAFVGKRGSRDPFRAVFIASDEGAYGASMYAYGANYMTENVKNDTQRSIVLPGGQRALLTSYTKDSFGVESFVGKRFVVRTSCMNATEAQCIDAFAKWDFKAVEALKP